MANLTKINNEIAQSFEAMKEKQLDERTREILHDLGIPLIMPTPTTLSEIQRAETINYSISEAK